MHQRLRGPRSPRDVLPRADAHRSRNRATRRSLSSSARRVRRRTRKRDLHLSRPLTPRVDSSVLRTQAGSASPADTSRFIRQEHIASVTKVDCAVLRSLEVLLHRDGRGRAIGMRITGVRPGGWADKFGFEVGDVIETESATQLKNPQSLRKAARLGWRSQRVTVRRDIWVRRIYSASMAPELR